MTDELTPMTDTERLEQLPVEDLEDDELLALRKGVDTARAKAAEDELDRRDERAYDRQQERLASSEGYDDSHYRASMRDAGRGHLLP